MTTNIFMARLVKRTAVAVGIAGLTPSIAIAQDGANGAAGADWPQWRGPALDGISVETDWASVGKPEPLWTKQLGFGHSSFAVSGDRVFAMGYDLDAKLDVVYCFDAATGEEVWTHKYPAEFWNQYHDGGTLTTPTVVGETVYTSNREGKLFSLDAATGDVHWSRDLRKDLGVKPPTWGFSASPLIVGDLVVMNLGKVVALDRETGDRAWVTKENRGHAYSTPAPFELDGQSYLASMCGDGVSVIDTANGKEIDFFAWGNQLSISPMTPIVIGDRIFVSAGYDHGCTMLKLTDGNLEEVWASHAMRNKMSGCILWEDHLYGFDESILKCIDLDGNEKWRQRGLGTGALSIAGGRLVILDGKGRVIVAEANPNEYVELSHQEVLSGGTFWSTPVLSHGRVYCRSSLGQMACLDFSESDAGSDSQH